jgi:hypothetical protein
VTAPAVGRYPVGNSAAALALAGIVGVALHELAHAVAGLVVGVTPTVYRSTVTYVPVPEVDGRIATAATGPLFSLVLGIVVFLTCRGAGRGFGRLFALWLGLVAMQNFYGYCLIAPIAAEGDSGIVLGLAGAPGWVYAVAVVIGVAGTLLNARLFAGQVIRYGRDPDELRRLVLFPWLIGTGVLVAFDLLCLYLFTPGGPAAVIVAGSVAIAIFAPVFTLFYRRLTAPADPLTLSRPVGPWTAVAVAAAIVLVVIAPGLRL